MTLHGRHYRLRLLPLIALASLALAPVAFAGPGSGVVSLVPAEPVTAGSSGSWSLVVRATEPFDAQYGGRVTVTMPVGWSAPSLGPPIIPGHVRVTSTADGAVDSVRVSGRTLEIHAGAAPGPSIEIGDELLLVYGASAPGGAARAQRNAAPGVTFAVTTTPDASLVPAPIAMGSPAVDVVSDVAASLTWVPSAVSLIAGEATSVRLVSHDRFGNPSAPGVGQLVDLTSSAPTLEFLRQGTAIQQLPFPADSTEVQVQLLGTLASPAFSMRAVDADALVPDWTTGLGGGAVTAGGAAGFRVSGATDPVTAGHPSPMVVEVVDAFGNRSMDYSGSIRFTSSDGLAQLPDIYTFDADDAGQHTFIDAVRLFTAGEQSLRVEDVADAGVFGVQNGIGVVAGPTTALGVDGITDPLVAGERASVRVTAYDAFGNVARGYTGTVQFAATDVHPLAELPAAYTFTIGDAGERVFLDGVRLVAAGVTDVSVADDEGRSAMQASITVRHAAAASAVLAPPALVPVNADADRTMSLTVLDVYGNAVPGESATIAIDDAADGMLADDPANPNDTSGDAVVQTGVTDAAGRLTVLYQAPAVPGSQDLLHGWTTGIPEDSVTPVTVLTTPGGATQIVWSSTGAAVDTAGAAVPLRIELADDSGAADATKSSLVELTSTSPSTRFSDDGGGTWSATSTATIAVINGSTGNQLRVRDTTAGTPTLAARDLGNFLAAGVFDALELTPAPPAGDALLVAVPDTLTADASSMLAVSGGPVTDRFGNVTREVLMTVDVVGGGVVEAIDVDDIPGVQRRTGSDGRFRFDVRAPGVAGSATVQAVSVEGSAAGTHAVTYVSPVSFALDGGTLVPSTGVVGDPVQLVAPVRNLGTQSVLLDGNTRVTLSGNGVTFEALLETPTSIPGGLLAVAPFVTTLLPADLAPGRYTPTLELRGRDAHGATVESIFAASVGSFAAESIEIESVLAPAVVSRGQSSVAVELVVANRGDGTVVLSDVGLDFTEPGFVVGSVMPAPGVPLGPRSSRAYTMLVDVDPLAPLGAVGIEGHATGTVSGFPITAGGAATAALWTAVSAADIAPLGASLAPAASTPGQTHPAGIVVENRGGAALELDGQTRLEFAGGDLVTTIAASTLVAGGETVALPFDDLVVPADYAPGTYDARLALSGTENGMPIDRVLPLADVLVVTGPSAPVAVAGSLRPASVAQGQNVAFAIDVRNEGDSPITFGNATVLDVGGVQTAPLAVVTTIAPGATETLPFGNIVVDVALAAGQHALTIEADIREFGIRRTSTVPVDDLLTVTTPGRLRWVAGSLSPARVTQGQAGVALSVEIENDGGTALTVGGPGSRWSVTDGVDVLDVPYSGGLQVIAPGGIATLVFQSATVPESLANQSYAPSLELPFEQNGEAGAATVVAPDGVWTVQTPVEPGYVAGSLAPRSVTPGDEVTFTMRIANDGEAALRPDATTILDVGGLQTALDVDQSPAQIAEGETGELVFLPVTIGGPATAGMHQVELQLAGVDWNGKPVASALDLAGDELLVLEDAMLRVLSLDSLAPGGSRANTGQAIDLALTIANLGEEPIVDLELVAAGSGIAASPGVLIGTLAGSDTTTVSLPIVLDTVPLATVVRAEVLAGRGEVSGVAVGVAPALDDTLAMVIQTPASLSTSIAVIEPVGAIDGVLSTGSVLDVEALVTNGGQAAVGAAGRMTLQVPAGYAVLGPAEQTFQAGQAVSFAVAVPLDATASSPLRAVISHVPADRNLGSAAAVTQPSAQIAVAAVAAAQLRVDWIFTAPDNLVDDRFAFAGQLVTVEARITNEGTAGVDDEPALEIVLDPEIQLDAGETSIRTAPPGQPVQWRLVAPATHPAPRLIAVRLANAGDLQDENTGADAIVSRGRLERELSVAASPVSLTAAPLPAGSPHVAPGQRGVRALAFTIEQQSEGGSGADVQLEALEVQLVDAAGAPIDAARAIDSVTLVDRVGTGLGRGVAAAGDAASPQTVRIVLDQPDAIQPGASRSYAVLVDLAPSPSPAAFAVVIPAERAVEARDVSSGALLSPGFEQALRSATFTVFDGPHNFPNPFAAGRETTTLAYVLDGASDVTVDLFTLFGDRVWSARFAAGTSGGAPGLNQVLWDGRNDDGSYVRNGVYVCRVQGDSFEARWKIAVAR